MPDEARILELVEELLDSGGEPEDVCGLDGELLGEVRRRWARCKSVEYQLQEMFPPSDSGVDGPEKRSSRFSTELPEIPGYNVDSILGRGGMGGVYKARHLKLRRTVAIKMLLAGAYAGREELARFTREAESVASLRHAHIVQVHDVGEIEGRPYFTMEFVEGGSLAQKLAGGAPQPAREAAT